MDDSTKINPLYDPKTDNAVIADDVQSAMNKPLVAEGGFSDEDKSFLDTLMQLVNDGKINLHQPSSLLNSAVYDSASSEAKGKADQNTITMLARIRDIHGLMQVNPEPTYQVQNMVADLRQKKEKLEEIGGDLFII